MMCSYFIDLKRELLFRSPYPFIEEKSAFLSKLKKKKHTAIHLHNFEVGVNFYDYLTFNFKTLLCH